MSDESFALISDEDRSSTLDLRTCMEKFYAFNLEAQKNIRWFLDKSSITFSFDDFMICATLFALFGDSAKIMTTDKWADYPFEAADTICLFFFIFELVCNTYCRTMITSFWPFRFHGYMMSFYWFLDIISIGSYFPDIPWIANGLQIGNQVNSLSSSGQVVRLVRLVRLLRLLKVWSDRQRRRAEESKKMTLVKLGLADYAEVQASLALYENRQSKLGAQLSDTITQRVVLLVLLLIIVLPTLDYNAPDNSADYGVNILHDFNCNTNISQAAKQIALNTFINQFDTMPDSSYVENDKYLLRLQMTPFQQDYIINYVSTIESLRTTSMKVVSMSSVMSNGQTCTTSAIFNIQNLAHGSALFDIITTIFIGVMLTLGAYVFINDAQKLVLDPIERMMNMVEQVSKDPLQPLHFEHSGLDGSSTGDYETKLLESTIEKITGLLRVGFGEAGAGIIKSNLKIDDPSSIIDPLLPGKRVYAVVGFCDIHHFEEVLLLLNKDIMIFVNTIAEIVHSNVTYWGGQVNKNLGNAFVVIWRIGDEDTIISKLGSIRETSTHLSRDSISRLNQQKKKKNAVINLARVPGVDRMADQALIGYLKIICEINRSKAILDYRNEPRLTHEGQHEFKVRMGFGLHAGWAIEGAVGSIYKVDATYLSPHVNMAARLETSSRQYGVPLLASHFFHDLMSEENKHVMRRIDVCTVKGSEVPIGVFTYDALQDQVFPREKKKQKQVDEDGLSIAALSEESGEEEDEDYSSDTRSVQTPPRKSITPRGSMTSTGSGAAAAIFAFREEYKNTHSGDEQDTDIERETGGATVSFQDDVEPITSQLGKANRPLSVHTNTSDSSGGRANNDETSSPHSTSHSGSHHFRKHHHFHSIFRTNKDETSDVFELDADMIALRAHITPAFLDVFREGLEAYLAGKWPTAKKQFDIANKMMTEMVPGCVGDGPCMTLLEYMEERNWTAPDDWAGFRPLTSK